jgi:hypothetical protein
LQAWAGVLERGEGLVQRAVGDSRLGWQLAGRQLGVLYCTLLLPPGLRLAQSLIERWLPERWLKTEAVA